MTCEKYGIITVFQRGTRCDCYTEDMILLSTNIAYLLVSRFPGLF